MIMKIIFNSIKAVVSSLAICICIISGIQTSRAVPPAHFLGQSWNGGTIYWLQTANGPVGTQYLIMGTSDLCNGCNWYNAYGSVPPGWYLPTSSELHKLCL